MILLPTNNEDTREERDNVSIDPAKGEFITHLGGQLEAVC